MIEHIFRRFRGLERAVAFAGVARIALAFAGLGVTFVATTVIAEPMLRQTSDPSAWAHEIAPIGVPVTKYFDIPESAKGPEIDPQKGYRLEDLGRGLYMVTDNLYQSMFAVYEEGVILVDAPSTYSARLKAAIAEVSDKPITHVIYSHSHADHIAGVGKLGLHATIIAHSETKRLLERAADPDRPVPTVTFDDAYELRVGNQHLELSYHGNGHEPGNIFIYAPEQRTLMVVDLVFPGWMPFRRFAVAQDVPGYFAQVRAIDAMPFEKLVAGHVSRLGTHADVKLQIELNDDIRAAAAEALATIPFGKGVSPADASNPWAKVDDFTARVAGRCVDALTPKWKNRVAAYDTFVWDQCYAMEQSLRID